MSRRNTRQTAGRNICRTASRTTGRTTRGSTGRRPFLATVTVGAATAIAGCLGDSDDSPADSDDHEDTTGASTIQLDDGTQYQGPACGCCEAYTPYLESQMESHLASALESSVDGDLEVVVTEDLAAYKDAAGIPQALRSCHTVVLDGYVFEGHLPVEPIEDFLNEAPDSLGIALPGMPAGSPGMGGEKDEPWTIFEFFSDGGFTPYTDV